MFRATGLGLAFLCAAAAQELQVQDSVIPPLQVDKNGNASIALTLKNATGEPLPGLDLSADFLHNRYSLNATLAVAGIPDASALKTPIAKDATARVKLSFSGLWEAGQSDAALLNGGVPVTDTAGKRVVLHALRLPGPWNVQFQDPNTEPIFGEGWQPTVRLVNNDAMTYQFDWEIELPSRPVARGKSTIVLPANSVVDFDLASAGLEGGWWNAGTLKDEVIDATLVLKPKLDATVPLPPQAAKRLPMKVRLHFWHSGLQEFMDFFWTLTLLVIGAAFSLGFRLYIPNALGAYKLKRQLNGLYEKIRGADDDLSSQWRVLITWQIDNCNAAVDGTLWATPGFTSLLTELQTEADMYSQWVEIAYDVALVLAETSRAVQMGVPPTLIGLIREKCDEALAPIATGLTTAEELQGMKLALKTAQDYSRAIVAHTAVPALEAVIKEREDAVTKSVDVLKTNFPQFGCLLDQVKSSGSEELKPVAYLDRDTFSLKADLLRQYCEIKLRVCCGVTSAQPQLPAAPVAAEAPAAVAAQPAPADPCCGGAANQMNQATACGRLQTRGAKFLEYLVPDAYESLRVAELFVLEMRQDFYPCPALCDELKKSPPAIKIHAHPRPDPNSHPQTQPTSEVPAGGSLLIHYGVPVRFSLRFDRQALNEIAAPREWACYWDFGDGTEREGGWDVYHLYSPKVQMCDVKATLVTLEGNQIDVAITRKVDIRDPAEADSVSKGKNGWISFPSMSPEGKLEAARFAFTMALALAGVFATARGKVEALTVAQGAGALIALGFSADTLKNLLTQKAGDK